MMNPHLHIIFDLLACLASATLFRLELPQGRKAHEDNIYWTYLILGATLGAYFLGSLNLSLSDVFRIGHSIAGALMGGIVAAEIYKWRRGITRSTGAIFVLPLTAAIAIGRWGCFMEGLPDETYGIPTSLPWGVDFGDGIPRHPVQIYESLALVLFIPLLLLWRRRSPEDYSRRAFYVFAGYYAAQRFIWEFLKPYPNAVGLNVFHLACVLLFGYALFMLRRAHASRPAAAA